LPDTLFYLVVYLCRIDFKPLVEIYTTLVPKQKSRHKPWLMPAFVDAELSSLLLISGCLDEHIAAAFVELRHGCVGPVKIGKAFLASQN
jgi:hypothetical protein